MNHVMVKNERKRDVSAMVNPQIQIIVKYQESHISMKQREHPKQRNMHRANKLSHPLFKKRQKKR